MTTEMSPPSELHPLPQRIIKNTLFGTAGNWFLLFINFLIIPYIVHHLGVDMYGGAWIVGAIVLSFTGLFDFGIASSCTKYIAEYSSTKQYEAVNAIISTGIVFYMIFGGLLTLLVLGFGHPLLSLIGVPAHLLQDAFFVLSVALIIMILTNALAPITTTVTALQRMDISNMIVVVTSILTLGMTVTVLQLRWGVRGLIVGNLFVQLFSISWMVYWAKRLLPEIAPRFSKVRWETFQQLSRYGGNLQLSRISQIVVFQTDKMLALRFFGTSSAAFYEVAVKVASLARTIPLVLSSALLPAASEMDGRKEDHKVGFLFERGSKYLIIVGLLILGFVFSESHLIVSTWMRQSLGIGGINIASILIKILLAGYFLNMSTGAASAIAAGIGRTEFERRLGVFLLIATPCLLVIFIKVFGFYGIPMATSLSLSLGSLYYMVTFCHALGKRVSQFWLLFLKPSISIAVAVVLMKSFQLLVFRTVELSRIEGVLSLGILFIVTCVPYIGALLVLKTFDEYDFVIAKALFGKLRAYN